MTTDTTNTTNTADYHAKVANLLSDTAYHETLKRDPIRSYKKKVINS